MPRTLAQNAEYIANTIKPAIKSAIEAQGVTVPSTDSFLDYADRIAEIEGGGSGYQLKDLPTGAISTVNDAAPLSLNALKVSVEAVQDLHGQSAPYPEGGSAQKWDEEWEVGAYNTSTGEKSTSTAKIRCKNPIPVNASTTYYALTNSYAMRVFYYDSNNAFLESPSAITNSTFTTPSNCAYITFHMADTYGTTYGNNLGINYPSSDTSYHPYSNICTIEGWDEGNIGVNQKNWCPRVEQNTYNNDGSTYTSSTRCRTPIMLLKGGKTYTVSFSTVQSKTLQAVSQTWRNNSYTSNVLISQSGWNNTAFTITTTSDTYWSATFRYLDNSTVSASDLTCQAELSTTPTTYEPYQGKQYTQQFPITVYGAEWDVVNGILKTRPYYASYNGETLVGPWISSMDEYTQGGTPTTGAQVVDMGGTETTIDLSPLSIRMNEGTNNLYADCGGVIEGEYFVDEGAHRYQLYDYIESDGTQVIDLGRQVVQGQTVKTVFHLMSDQVAYAWLFGAGDASHYYGFQLPQQTTLLVYNGSTSSSGQMSVNTADEYVYNLVFTASDSLALNYYAFGFNYSETPGGNNKGKFRLYSISIGGDVYLPAKRKSDGVFGLWDVANQIFLTDSAGGNAFVGGNPTGVEV